MFTTPVWHDSVPRGYLWHCCDSGGSPCMMVLNAWGSIYWWCWTLKMVLNTDKTVEHWNWPKDKRPLCEGPNDGFVSFQGHEAIVTISGLVTLMQRVVSSESDSNIPVVSCIAQIISQQYHGRCYTYKTSALNFRSNYFLFCASQNQGSSRDERLSKVFPYELNSDGWWKSI